MYDHFPWYLCTGVNEEKVHLLEYDSGLFCLNDETHKCVTQKGATLGGKHKRSLPSNRQVDGLVKGYGPGSQRGKVGGQG